MKLRRGSWIALLALSFLSQRSDGQTTLPVTDSHLFFSPYTWNIPTTSGSPVEIVANQPGAYLVMQVSNGNSGSSTVTVNLDLAGSPSPDSSMTVTYLVTPSGGSTTTGTAGVGSNVSISVPSGVSTIRFYYSGTSYGSPMSPIDRWALGATLTNGASVPRQTLRLTGVTLASGVSIQSPSLRPKRILFYGDSITEGSAVSSTAPANDATKSYTLQCAALLNAEYGNVGTPGQGWTVSSISASIGVPKFPLAYDLHYASTSRFTTGTPTPDYIVLNMGTNDFIASNTPLQENTVTTAALSWLSAIRSAFPSSEIFVVVPFGGFEKAALQSAYTQYVGVSSPDTNIRFINLGQTASVGLTSEYDIASAQSIDGIHPNIATQQLLAYQLAAAMQTAMGRQDFNGDGKSDLLLQNTSTNQVGFWYMSGTMVLNPSSSSWYISDTPDSNYALVGCGDFNGDGKPDLVFQHRTNGQIAVWFMNGSTHTSGVLVSDLLGSDYKVVAIADFDGDGNPDIVLQSQSTNTVAVQYMSGTTPLSTSTVSVVPSSGYTVVGAADFNRDGKPDLLFQNTSVNGLALWYMNGITRTAGESIGNGSPSGYNVEAVVDLDGDGRPDIVLRNQTTGSVSIWHVDNATLYSTELTSIPLYIPSGTSFHYKIAGPH